MIYSERQYSVAQAELEKLKAALNGVVVQAGDSDAWVRQIEADSLRSQIEDIEAELAEYDLMKSGQVSFAESFSLSELPRVLVHARIALGLSQTDLAEKMKMKPQQIQRYEATNYMGASLARLIEVSDLLGVKISESFVGNQQATGSVFAWNNTEDVVWDRLPSKEMIKRKWFELSAGQSIQEAVRDFFLRAAGPHFVSAFHRKKVCSGNIPNQYALLAWQARVLDLAKNEFEAGTIAEFELNDKWLGDLVRLTKRKDGPRRAKKLLAENGIALVIERHLPGSYLDGAAMLASFGVPVIGLTLRYDRLDNFWFVLFHELGHVFKHLYDGLRFDFFDEEGGNGDDRIESEADEFSLNTLIPQALWGQCLSRFALSEEAVKIDADNLGIDPSIIAGRIRKERGDYTILNNLIGLNTVRTQLEVQES